MGNAAFRPTQEDLRGQIAKLEQQLLASKDGQSEAEKRAAAAEEEAKSLRAEVEELNSRLVSSPTLTDNHSAEFSSAKAQEQMIKQLERDLESAKTELKRVRQKYEQQIQRVKSSSAKSQAETALVVFQLREENSKLQDENSTLHKRVTCIQSEPSGLSHEKMGDHACHKLPPGDTGGRADHTHTKLVLELSEQVSSLSEELRQARDTIRRLEEKDCYHGNSAVNHVSADHCL